MPKETNKTLAGRARNRRVELTRQSFPNHKANAFFPGGTLMRLTTLVFAALLCAASAASASDDLTVVYKNTHNGKPADPSTYYIANDHMRMDVDEGNGMIMELKTGTMTQLDSKEKTYYTTTKADLDAFAAKMAEKMNDPEMKQGMAMMSGMAKAMSEYEVVVQKTGQTREVAGFHCEEWLVKTSEFTTMKECVTTKLQYPAHAYDAFKDYGESMRQAMRPMIGSATKGMKDREEKMKLIKGFPVASSTVSEVMGNKTTTETEVTEIRHSPIPASTWEVPADYTKVENPMMKAFETRGRSHPR